MAKFITLAGRKQVGKDTSANMIADMLELTSPGKVNIVHFADALKKACNIIFGIPLEDMETETGKQKLTHVIWPDSQLRQISNDPLGHEVVGYAPHHPQGGKPTYMTVREVLQFVGTNLFRNQMDPDVWLNSVFNQRWRDDDIVIIADARFPNEARLGRENGLLISVERDTGLGDDGHASENALADYTDYHYTINNNGSFQALREKLGVILNANELIA